MADESGILPASPPEVAIPELDSVIEKGNASLAHLIVAYHGANTELGAKFARSREVYRTKYPKIKVAYESSRGKIRALYVCDCLRSGAAVTESGNLEIVHSFSDTSKLARILGECSAKADEAKRLLRGEARLLCNEEYFSIASHILEYYDVQAGASKPSYRSSTPQDVESLIIFLLGKANARLRSSANRMAKLEYLKGMLVCAVAMAAAALIFYTSPLSTHATPNFLFCVLLAGATGSMVSVLSRMTFGRLRLDYEAGSSLLRLFGGFRIIIGAVLGMAITLLMRGDLLPIAIRTSGSEQLYSYAGFAFLAGFAERWAQDVLSMAGDRLRAVKGSRLAGGDQEVL